MMATATVDAALIDDYREAFASFDEDGSGTIDRDELRAALRVLGVAVADDELQRLVEAADADGSGDISFDEFVQLLEKKRAESAAASATAGEDAATEEMRVVFRALDRDRDGRISLADLRLATAAVHWGTDRPPRAAELIEMLRLGGGGGDAQPSAATKRGGGGGGRPAGLVDEGFGEYVDEDGDSVVLGDAADRSASAGTAASALNADSDDTGLDFEAFRRLMMRALAC